MSTPRLEDLVPSKAKTWVALVGSVLSFVIPFVLEVSDSLPTPWPALVGALVAVLTALGVYRAPYKPAGTVVAPAEAIPAGTPTDEGVAPVTPNEPDKFKNPWR